MATERSSIALVIAGGDPPPAGLFTTLPPPVITVAADSGINHARALDLGVDVLVGDLDSADAASIQWAADRGATVDVHPAGKDQTDLELALDRGAREANTLGADELVVVGWTGGRIDHWLANLLTLAGPLTASIDVTAYGERSRVSVVRNYRRLTGRRGELISLLPVGGPAVGVTTVGLDYPLSDETLDAGSSRGVSNVFAAPEEAEHNDADGRRAAVAVADITVRSGTLLAVQPEHLALHTGDGPAPDDAVPSPNVR